MASRRLYKEITFSRLENRVSVGSVFLGFDEDINVNYAKEEWGLRA